MQTIKDTVKITGPKDVRAQMSDIIGKPQEHFVCLSLNGANELIARRIVTIGLLDQSQVHPREVFADVTGIKTNLLFFTKGEPTKTVWYYEHPYPPGVKSYNKTRPIDIQEFKAEKDWWCNDTPAGRARRKETPLAWQVTLDEIKARNYNLDIKNPNAEAARHGDPDELLADYKKLLAEVAAARDALKKELAAALECSAKETG